MMAESRIVGYVPQEGVRERTKLLRLKVRRSPMMAEVCLTPIH